MSSSDNNNLGSLVKGVVVSDYTNDPLSLNRLQVYIPSIHGEYDEKKVGVAENEADNTEDKYPWAQCSILEKLSTIPKYGETVWIMFETNNTRLPVVIGRHTAGMVDTEASQGTGIAGGTLAEIAASIIFGNEGNYESVAWNDNGAISIGKIQWHANRAKNLLNKIREKNQSGFDSIDNGSGIVSSLGNDWSRWKNWTAGCPAGRALKSILATNESHTAQDEQALSDVQGYLDTAASGGITDPKCLIYLADIINQYGSCQSLVKSGINDLDKLHQYALSNGYGRYATRRNNTVQAIKNAEQAGKFVENGLTGLSGGTGGALQWPCPTISYISSKFGWRGAISGTSHKGANFHNGIDIAGAAGSKIVAANAGQVIRNQYNAGGYGNYVMIQGDGYVTLYGHMSAKSGLAVGSTVQKGTYIGPVGSTGNSSGPHCHFTVIPIANYNPSKLSGQASNAVDPLTLVSKPQ